MTIHIRLRSRISVRHTTRESMLNPRPARIPDTRESTPGSFCTRQFSTCLCGERNGVNHSRHQKAAILSGNGSSQEKKNEIEKKGGDDLLFERLEARRGRVVEDVRHRLFCGSGPRQVHLGKRWRLDFVRGLVVERGRRVVDGTGRFGRFI